MDNIFSCLPNDILFSIIHDIGASSILMFCYTDRYMYNRLLEHKSRIIEYIRTNTVSIITVNNSVTDTDNNTKYRINTYNNNTKYRINTYDISTTPIGTNTYDISTAHLGTNTFGISTAYLGTNTFGISTAYLGTNTFGISTYILDAAKHGYCDILQQFDNSLYTRKLQYGLCITAALYGQKSVLKLASEYGFPYKHRNCYYNAARGCQLSTLKWLFKQDNKFKTNASKLVEAAVRGVSIQYKGIGYDSNSKELISSIQYKGIGYDINSLELLSRLEVIKFVLDYTSAKTDKICEYAAKYGQYDVLKWGLDNRYYDSISNIVACIINYNHYHLLELVYSIGYVSSYIPKMLAYKGELEYLKQSIDVGCGGSGVCNAAASERNYHILDWALENKLPYDNKTLLFTLCQFNDVDILKKYMDYGVRWEDITPFLVNNSCIDILKYAKENDYYISPDICKYAARDTHMFKWAVKNGYNYMPYINKIVEHRNILIIRWLDRDKCCSCKSEYKNSDKLDSRLRESCKSECLHSDKLNSRNYPLGNIYYHIVRYHDKELVEWLLDSKYIRDNICNDLIAEYANPDILELALNKGYTVSRESFVTLLRFRNINMLNVIHGKGHMFDNDVYKDALHDIRLVKWLYANGYKPDKSLIFDYVSMKGKTDIMLLKWLLIKLHIISDDIELINTAIDNNKYDIVRYLIKNGYKYTDEIKERILASNDEKTKKLIR